MKVTIGIPSFQRGQEAYYTLQNLLHLPSSTFEVLIIDNGSDLNNYARVRSLVASQSHFKYIRIEKNLGFYNSLLCIFENTTTEYLLLLSDEDDFSNQTLESLINFLIEFRPSFVALPSKHIRGGLDSGNFKSRKIRDFEMWGISNYLSGLVFQSSTSSKYLGIIRELTSIEEFARLYPHVILSWCNFAEHQSYKVNQPYFRQRVELESIESTSNKYWEPTKRLEMVASALRCLNSILQVMGEDTRANIDELEREIRKSLFGVIYGSIELMEPDLAKDFLNSALRTSLRRLLSLTLKKSIRKFLRLT